MSTLSMATLGFLTSAETTGEGTIVEFVPTTEFNVALANDALRGEMENDSLEAVLSNSIHLEIYEDEMEAI